MMDVSIDSTVSSIAGGGRVQLLLEWESSSSSSLLLWVHFLLDSIAVALSMD